MDIETLIKRQALLAWRDTLIMSVWRLVNKAGIDAKRSVESDLSEAGLVDTLWDPAGFTRARVDSVMHASTLPELKVLFIHAAADLRAINPGYGGLADALLEPEFLALAGDGESCRSTRPRNAACASNDREGG